MSFQRWPNHPNDWPTGMKFTRPMPGFLNRLLLRTENGVVGKYRYMSGSTMVPILWETSREIEWVHISAIPDTSS